MRQWLGNFVGYDTRFFPKVSPMLGFSFSFSFAAGERYVVLDGDGKEGKKEGRKEGRTMCAVNTCSLQPPRAACKVLLSC